MKKVIALALALLLLLPVTAFIEADVRPVYIPKLIDVMNDMGILVIDDSYSFSEEKFNNSLYSYNEFRPTDGIVILENFKDGKSVNYVIRFDQSVAYAMKYKEKLMVSLIEIVAGYQTKKATSIVDYLQNTLKPDDLGLYEGVSSVSFEPLYFDLLNTGLTSLSFTITYIHEVQL